ncbi:MAG: tetratricopeptide repeat protein, partial [Candidatus Neomarinimicrobiota bacterium]|nr:tetratricopeptide repeat protein [Candidatus Neomarinimicrobiota bacterium]
PLHSKALFTLSLIYADRGDTLMANQTIDSLVHLYPNSEFASHLQFGTEVAEKPEQTLYRNAEKQWEHNPDSARHSFRTIIHSFAQSDLSVSAAYYLGYQYDQSAEIDSAVKYYSWIQKNHPNSEHAVPAKERLAALQMALAEIAPDTTAIDPVGQIEN